MEILEYLLIVVLLLSAVFIIAAVIMQKSNEDGLSGTIAGGQETFYGRDKSSHADRIIAKRTSIVAIVFVVAVAVVYIIQPDYSSSYSLDDWMSQYLNNYYKIY
jgi:preprotein translocase subunit SecG